MTTGGELTAPAGEDERNHAESPEHVGQVPEGAGLPPDAPQAGGPGKGQTHGGLKAPAQAPRVLRPYHPGAAGTRTLGMYRSDLAYIFVFKHWVQFWEYIYQSLS